MSTHEHAHGYKQYFVTWCWLLAMTLTALVIGYFRFSWLPEGARPWCSSPLRWQRFF